MVNKQTIWVGGDLIKRYDNLNINTPIKDKIKILLTDYIEKKEVLDNVKAKDGEAAG